MEVYKACEDQPYYLKELYIPLEELDEEWIWTVGEVKEFDRLWKLKIPVREMAKILGCYEATIVIMAFDRLIKGEIKPRKGWKMW